MATLNEIAKSATRPSPPPQPKPVERGTVPKNAEIESIKRTLYNAIDKLDRLTAK